MNDLRSFAVLQARVYEFLEQQDETTLQAIVGGTARLAVLGADDAQVPRNDLRTAPRPASAGLTMTPSRDPLQAAQHLLGLATEQERRIYLNAANLPVKVLKEVVKCLGLHGYSKLIRDALIDLLARHGLDQTAEPPNLPTRQVPPSPELVEDNSEPKQQTPVKEAPQATQPDAQAAAIAARLRETDTEEEGAEYLKSLHLSQEGLLAVAAELQLTRVERLSQKELRQRVLKQAIGARRKFAGLRKW